MANQIIDLTKEIAKTESAILQWSHAPQGRAEIGRSVLNAVKNHFVNLNAERKSAWSRGKGFYAEAADGTHMDVVEDGFEIVTDKAGLNLRIEGGTVTPGKGISCATGKATKYLSIPAIAEAYGISACTFGNLRFVKFGNGENAPAALIETGPKSATIAATGKKVRNRFNTVTPQGAFGRRVFYWLVKSTTHKADPSVAPDLDALQDVAMKAAEAYHAKFNN